MNEGLLTGTKSLKNSCITQSLPEDSNSSLKLETWSTLYAFRQLRRSQWLFRQPSWSESVPGSSMVSASSRHLGWSESVFQQTHSPLARKGLVNLISFRDFLKHLSCLVPKQRESFLSLRKMLHNKYTCLVTFILQINQILSHLQKSCLLPTIRDILEMMHPDESIL